MILTSLEREHLYNLLLHRSYLDEERGCRLGKWGKGHGNIRFRGRSTIITRLAYAVFKGDFDDKWCVLHKCDVPNCINPEHLFLGTNTDNIADRDAKGRQAKGEKQWLFGKGHLISGKKNGRFGKGYLTAGEKNGMYGKTGEKHPMFGKGHLLVGLHTGEKNPKVKLRECQVLEILSKRKEGLFIKDIARLYSVSYSAVQAIVSGKTWQHIQRPPDQ